uniref:cAMP-regulated phosphoprotein 19-related protein n=1 Tax=Setaria italica TaxID=4555 RepID=K3XMZ6_SETIT
MSEMKDSTAAALDGNPEPMDQTEDNSMPSAQQQEEAIKKKFGGLMPKKPPLISKDHERAYFDSADWALGKQGVAKPKGPLEALRPKLQVSLVVAPSNNTLLHVTLHCCSILFWFVSANTPTTAATFKALHLHFVRKRGWRRCWC